MSDILIEARGIGKRYRRGTRLGINLPRLSRLWRRNGDPTEDEFWALKDIDLEIRQGDALGIIGPNGAGKSTLLKILSRVTAPTEGTLKVRGRVGALIEVGAGFHPELTGRDNMYINGAILGMSRREIARRLDEIVAFAELEEFIDTPVKKYSSGMYVRLGFAVAAHMDPDILLVDEVLAVGDMAFQRRCIERMKATKQSGTAIVFVSHNLAQVHAFCDRGLLLHHGREERAGPISDVIAAYHSARSLSGTEPSQTTQGLGSLTIERVLVLDPLRLEPVEEVAFGGSIAVSIESRAAEPLHDVQYHIILVRWDGQVAGSTHSRLYPDCRGRLMPPGLHTVRVVLDDLRVVPGSYALHVWATDGEHLTDYDVNRTVSIRVAGSYDIDQRYGSYVFRSTWHFPSASHALAEERPCDRSAAWIP